MASFAKIGVSKCHSLCSASDDLIAHGVKRFRKAAADAGAAAGDENGVAGEVHGADFLPVRILRGRSAGARKASRRGPKRRNPRENPVCDT